MSRRRIRTTISRSPRRCRPTIAGLSWQPALAQRKLAGILEPPREFHPVNSPRFHKMLKSSHGRQKSKVTNDAA
jgi:hypothetical protein